MAANAKQKKPSNKWTIWKRIFNDSSLHSIFLWALSKCVSDSRKKKWHYTMANGMLHVHLFEQIILTVSRATELEALWNEQIRVISELYSVAWICKACKCAQQANVKKLQGAFGAFAFICTAHVCVFVLVPCANFKNSFIKDFHRRLIVGVHY